MTPGDLVKIIYSQHHFAGWNPWAGDTGLIVAKYEHPSSTWGEWFTILLNGEQRNIREDHLEKIHEKG